ncbi:MAG: efflux RND transporter periplasmic adaptor subunit [Phycisphaeraceae bacterium]|nr:efflux RND transporter periplasmic adaptor subunit [Phycisphaeraceae bacterium]
MFRFLCGGDSDLQMARRMLLVALAGTGVVSGCGRNQPQAGAAPQAPTVSIDVVAPVTVPGNYEFIAQTAASRTVEIRARVQGFLLKRHFVEGGPVKEGDLLFTIDPRSFEADVQIARAQLAQAKAQLALAESNLSRVKEGVEKGGIAQADLDKAQAQRDEAVAEVKLSEARVTNAELDLSYTRVLSPVSGTIGQAERQEGALVDSGQNSLLATSQQVDPIYVNFNVSERDVLKWRSDVASGRIILENEKHLPTQITLSDGTVFESVGSINFVDVKVDPNTGTAMIRAEFPNKDSRLLPGQYVKLKVLGVERPNTLTVPQQAVLNTPNGTFVLVVGADGKAERRPVTLGDWLGSDWVVEFGLKAGERVIVDNIQKVQPGMEVKIAENVSDGAAAKAAPAGTPPKPVTPKK